MRIAIFTQNEPLFVPHALGPFLTRHADKATAIYLSGTGKRRQGRFSEAWRYLKVFGFGGLFTMVRRVAAAKWKSFWFQRGAFFSPVTPVDMATFCGLSVRYVQDYSSEDLAEELRQDQVDLVVSVSYNWILNKTVIDAPALGIINTHNAPLPKYRGLMPAFWQLLHDETESAVTVHRVVEKIDAGEILGQAPVPIRPDDTWESFVIRSKQKSGEVLSEVVDRFAESLESGVPLEGTPLELEEGSYFSFPGYRDGRAFRKERRFWGV